MLKTDGRRREVWTGLRMGIEGEQSGDPHFALPRRTHRSIYLQPILPPLSSSRSLSRSRRGNRRTLFASFTFGKDRNPLFSSSFVAFRISLKGKITFASLTFPPQLMKPWRTYKGAAGKLIILAFSCLATCLPLFY